MKIIETNKRGDKVLADTNTNSKDKKKWKKILGYTVLFAVILFFAYNHFEDSKVKKISITEFEKIIESDKVKEIKEVKLLDNVGIITYEIKKEKYTVSVPKNYIKENSEIIKTLKKENVKFKVENAKDWMETVFNVTRMLFTLIIIFFVYKIAEDYFKKFEVEEVKNETLTFDDVAGAEEIKEEFKDIIMYYSDTEKYKSFKEDLPKGILLEGPPGSGKTYLAKALAGTLKIPFFQKSAADLEGKYVGVGSENIGKFFATVRARAKEAGGAIMFLDELDSIASKRELRTVVETNQTINKFLTEMDGFEKDTNIIVIAATNLVSSLDEAVLRPGRFDRIIHIPNPSKMERIAVINLYLDKKKDRIEQEVYDENFVETLANITEGFSNAKLANMIKESSVLARRKGKDTIGIQDLREGFTKVIAGIKRNQPLSDEDKRIVAYHEAGHATLQILTSPLGVKGVAYITITPHGQSLGHVSPVTPDEKLPRKSQLEHRMMVVLAGRAVEEKILKGDFTVGAANDLYQMNQILIEYITTYGMSNASKNLFIKSVDENNEAFQTQAKEIRETIYQQTKDMIEEHYDIVEVIAEHLLQHESIEQYELEELLQETSYQK